MFPGWQAPAVNRKGFTSSADIESAVAMQYGMHSRKRYLDEDEVLENNEEDELEYQPAPGSPGGAEPTLEVAEEDDPLEAFMAGVEKQAKKDREASETAAKEEKPVKTNKTKLGRTDIEEEDMQESYFNWLEENKPNMLHPEDDDEEVEYDEEGNPIRKKKHIDPLPPLDHSTVEYAPFEKNFHVEHEDIEQMNQSQVQELRNKLGIKVTGVAAPKPVCSFAHFGFDEALMDAIRKSDYTQPTPIQAQAIPAELNGRDVIGIAKTGSGKTVAYLWPALVHIMDQRELEPSDGPICLICVPTRELAIQVYNEAKRFGKVYGLRVVCAYGGGSKWEQSKALKEGAEIVVGTPGRMIDMVQIGGTNLSRVTFLVFDEADRMFDLGFETQVRSIANHIRPDRQCLMFSATFKKKVERLARDILNDPIRIVQGELGEANEDIEQIVYVFAETTMKWPWLLDRLVQFCTEGKVLIFVTKKLNSEELANNLKAKDFSIGLLHGDMMQHDRNEVLQKFRKESMPVLVATDVAARGLDIPSIRTVINYDMARDIDTHVHRIGRTGRAGEKGRAYTLVSETAGDKEMVGHLVRNLESVGQTVPAKLMELAMQSAWFRKSRFKKENAKTTRTGLGYRSRGATEGATAVSSAGFGSSGPIKVREALNNIKPGSATNRIAAMKAAFSSSFQSSFHSASDGGSVNGQFMPITDPTPEWKKQAQAVEEALGTQKKKRSRWD